MNGAEVKCVDLRAMAREIGLHGGVKGIRIGAGEKPASNSRLIGNHDHPPPR